ncbi:MAG: ABC transporter ATP-binding protein, partial [Sulfobacillus sp.]
MPKQAYALPVLIRRFLPFVRPFVLRYTIAIGLLITTSLVGLLPPYFLKILIDQGIKARSLSVINSMAAALLGVILVSGITRWAMEYLHEWVSARFIASLRGHLFEHILGQSMGFFSTAKTGDILGRLKSDIVAVYGILVNVFLGALSEVVQIIAITAILLHMNVRLALMATGFVVPFYSILRFFGRRLRKMALATRDKDVLLLDFFQEKLSNIQLIKLFHREEYEGITHARLSEDLIGITLATVRQRFISVFLIGLFSSMAGVLVIWYGGHLVIRGAISFGSLFAFYLYTNRLYAPVQSLSNRSVEIYHGLASAQRIVEFLDLQAEIQEKPSPVVLARCEGDVAFMGVRFSYPQSDRPLFSDFYLHVNQGEKIALVGRSGAGKTTLLSLLARLYDVHGGLITIDGCDVRDMAFASLYEAIGFVT